MQHSDYTVKNILRKINYDLYKFISCIIYICVRSYTCRIAHKILDVHLYKMSIKHEYYLSDKDIVDYCTCNSFIQGPHNLLMGTSISQREYLERWMLSKRSRKVRVLLTIPAIQNSVYQEFCMQLALCAMCCMYTYALFQRVKGSGDLIPWRTRGYEEGIKQS